MFALCMTAAYVQPLVTLDILSWLSYFMTLFKIVYTCVSICRHMRMSAGACEDHKRALETPHPLPASGVTCGCEPHDVDAGNGAQVLCNNSVLS